MILLFQIKPWSVPYYLLTLLLIYFNTGIRVMYEINKPLNMFLQSQLVKVSGIVFNNVFRNTDF